MRPAIRNAGGGGGGGVLSALDPTRKAGEGGGAAPLQARYKKLGEGVLSASGLIRKAGGGCCPFKARYEKRRGGGGGAVQRFRPDTKSGEGEGAV